MKIQTTFALFTLSVAVKGWTSIFQPIALTLGAALAALNLNPDLIPDILQPYVWKNVQEDTPMSKEEHLESLDDLIERTRSSLSDPDMDD